MLWILFSFILSFFQSLFYPFIHSFNLCLVEGTMPHVESTMGIKKDLNSVFSPAGSPLVQGCSACPPLGVRKTSISQMGWAKIEHHPSSVHVDHLLCLGSVLGTGLTAENLLGLDTALQAGLLGMPLAPSYTGKGPRAGLMLCTAS